MVNQYTSLPRFSPLAYWTSLKCAGVGSTENAKAGWIEYERDLELRLDSGVSFMNHRQSTAPPITNYFTLWTIPQELADPTSLIDLTHY